MKKPTVSSKYTTEYIQTDAVGFKITSHLLERLIEEAQKVGKQPQLLIMLNRNEKEKFIVDCKIKIEKSRG